MLKKLLGVGVFLIFTTLAFAEELTITTYYPSPYGSYNQLYVADKLGIGTTSPQTKLHIVAPPVESEAFKWRGQLSIEGSSSTDNAYITFYSGGFGPYPKGWIGFNALSPTSGPGQLEIGSYYIPLVPEIPPIVFTIGGNEAMRIADNRNVGIGGTVGVWNYPATSLDIRNATSIVQNVGGIYVESASNSVAPAIVFGIPAANNYGYLGRARAHDQGGIGAKSGDTVLGQVGGWGRLAFATWNGSDAVVRAVMSSDGNLMLGGTGDSIYRLEVNGNQHIEGNLTVTGTITASGLNAPHSHPHTHSISTDGGALHDHGSSTGSGGDLAEYMPVKGKLEQGEVVVFAFEEKGDFYLAPCQKEYDNLLAGVVSNEEALTMGEPGEGKAPIGLLGRLPIKVTTANGAIKKGDFLAASNIPGHAMRATQPGRVVAIALEDFSGGPQGETTAKILAFVQVTYAHITSH